MFNRFSAIIFLAGMFCLPLSGKVVLPALFSDHAVLARHNAVPVFGNADPGEVVTVSVAGQKQSVKADEKGKFLVEIDLSQASAGPHILQINEHQIKDVLIGGVFLASGQSNMAFALSRAETFAAESKQAANPQIRFFVTARKASDRPEKNTSGKWTTVSFRNPGAVSAVAYYFAKRVNQEAGIPVGIIQSSVGGTAVEAWMSKENLQKFPFACKKGSDLRKSYNEWPEKYRKFLTAIRKWEKRFDRVDLPEPHSAPAENVKWIPQKGPRIDGHGIVWLKNEITITEKQSAAGFKIYAGRTAVPASLWIDGKKMAEFTDDAWKYAEVECRTKRGEFAPGKHTVMVRFHISGEVAYFSGTPYFNGNSSNARTTIRSPWSLYREKDYGKYPAGAKKSRPKNPGRRVRYLWSQYYNGMIYPLLPYRLTGVIWYQGESNVSRAWEYRKLFPAMIGQWRKEFRDDNLPFYYVMLAPFRDKVADAGDGGTYGDLRASQMACLSVPHTGIAVISDAGEAKDIHPLDKKRPGERLAALALKNIYGKNIPCESPRAARASVNKGKVTVVFEYTYGGLNAAKLPEKYDLCKFRKQKARLVRNSPATQLEGFALADANGKWHWADKAEIVAPDKVEVSAAAVPEPVKIRYNYSNNPTCDLFNKAGFPAAPFEFLLK